MNRGALALRWVTSYEDLASHTRVLMPRFLLQPVTFWCQGPKRACLTSKRPSFRSFLQLIACVATASLPAVDFNSAMVYWLLTPASPDSRFHLTRILLHLLCLVLSFRPGLSLALLIWLPALSPQSVTAHGPRHSEKAIAVQRGLGLVRGRQPAFSYTVY